jgi:transposase InsO family protein
MSWPGTPQANAKAESFMHTLKAEEVDGKTYRSREDAESRIGAFIDDVYTLAGCTLRSDISRPLSSTTNSDKLKNVKQINPCPCHRKKRTPYFYNPR